MTTPTPFTHGLVVDLQIALPERTDAEALRLCAMQLRSIAAQLIEDAERWERDADGEGRPIEKAYPVGDHPQVSLTFARVFQSSHRLSASKPKPKEARRKTRSRTRPTRRRISSRSRATTKHKTTKKQRSRKR